MNAVPTTGSKIRERPHICMLKRPSGIMEWKASHDIMNWLLLRQWKKIFPKKLEECCQVDSPSLDINRKLLRRHGACTEIRLSW